MAGIGEASFAEKGENMDTKTMELKDAVKRLRTIRNGWAESGWQSEKDIAALTTVIAEIEKIMPDELPDCSCGGVAIWGRHLESKGNGVYDEHLRIYCNKCTASTGYCNDEDRVRDVWDYIVW